MMKEERMKGQSEREMEEEIKPCMYMQSFSDCGPKTYPPQRIVSLFPFEEKLIVLMRTKMVMMIRDAAPIIAG